MLVLYGHCLGEKIKQSSSNIELTIGRRAQAIGKLLEYITLETFERGCDTSKQTSLIQTTP